jgi:hypothetical protein
MALAAFSAASVDDRYARGNCMGRRSAAQAVHRSTRTRETDLFDA